MMTIVEFLLARIAEEEAFAGAIFRDGLVAFDGRVLTALFDDDLADSYRAEGQAVWNPYQRRLAECKAKREMIEAYDEEQIYYTLQLFAAVYADHPDYDPSWGF